MESREDRIGRARIISRLYELINSLTQEQQISLLRQLFRDDLPDYLFKMILDMPDNQQLMLIEQLEELAGGDDLWDEEKINVIDIDTRRTSRKPCVIVVDFSTEASSSQELINDISLSGAFIKTDQPLEVDQKVVLSFSVPDSEKSFDLAAKVVRCNGEGIGVQFTNLNRKQQDIMMSLIESVSEA